jgi:hypothetical protein
LDVLIDYRYWERGTPKSASRTLSIQKLSPGELVPDPGDVVELVDERAEEPATRRYRVVERAGIATQVGESSGLTGRTVDVYVREA